MSDDHSPGDGRQPYSDIGGSEARHAKTHDVRREQQTNPTGPDPVDESFAEDLAQGSPESIRQAQHDGIPATDDKVVLDALADIPEGLLAELAILPEGVVLDQGATYFDLRNRSRGVFTAMGGVTISSHDRIVAKKTTDHDTWMMLTGRFHDES